MSNFLSKVGPAQQSKGFMMMIYGPAKVGKSTFGAQIPNHIFLNLEDGLSYVPGANTLPFTTEYTDVKAMLTELATTQHNYKTLVVDSADVLENLIKKWIVAQQNNTQIKDIADIPFGRGYPLLMTETRKVMEMFQYLAAEKKMNIIFICHEEVKKMQPPTGAEYTYIAPSLYGKTTQGDNTLKIYVDSVDVIGYCTFKTIVKQSDTGFGGSRGVAVGTGERIMYVDASNPAFISGSRLPLPKQIEFSWTAFLNALKTCMTPAQPAQAPQEQPTQEQQ